MKDQFWNVPARAPSSYKSSCGQQMWHTSRLYDVRRYATGLVPGWQTNRVSPESVMCPVYQVASRTSGSSGHPISKYGACHIFPRVNRVDGNTYQSGYTYCSLLLSQSPNCPTPRIGPHCKIAPSGYLHRFSIRNIRSRYHRISLPRLE